MEKIYNYEDCKRTFSEPLLLAYSIIYFLRTTRDGQNQHMLMTLKSKSNHLNKGDLK